MKFTQYVIMALGVCCSWLTLSAQIKPKIEIPDTSYLVDELISIQIKGLQMSQNFQLVATTYDRRNRPWIAKASYQANEHGEALISQVVAKNGTYEGKDEMGLFWSALYNGISLEQATQRGTFSRRASLSYRTKIVLNVENQAIDSAFVIRSFLADGVVEEMINKNGLEGKLFTPKQQTKDGIVLVLAGSNGGLQSAEWRAALMASNGIPAMALAYFDYGQLPESLIELPLEYIHTAIKLLKQEYNFSKVAIYGFSKGSELALSYASLFPNAEVEAVIACSPTAYVWQGINQKIDVKSSWTIDEQPLPFVPWQYNQEVISMLRSSGPKEFRMLYQYSLESENNKEALRKARIPIEKIKAPILFFSGTKDGSWPASQMVEKMMKRLDMENAQHHKYNDAGHLIYMDYLPATDSERQGGQIFGGAIAANAKARFDSWRKTKAFLKKQLVK